MISNINGISVIICCYNSSTRLPQTLRHLALQEVSGFDWEIIIVDNNSSDNTAESGLIEWNKQKIDITCIVVREAEQGLGFARKKGWLTAKYDVVVYCDDDNWLEKTYLQTAFDIMSSDEKIGIAGGRSIAAFEKERPVWFDAFESSYAVGRQMENTGIANKRRYLVGAGMVVRKQILITLESLGFRSMLVGRKGKAITSGDDTELCLLTMFLGYNLYYDERLIFTHFITQNRLTWKYLVKMASYGFAIPQIYYYLYDYCYSKIAENATPDFTYALKRNIRKPLRDLIKNNCRLKRIFISTCMLLVSIPGEREEIQLKARINRLKYVLLNIRKLQADYNTIHCLMQKLHRRKFNFSNT